jgi:hypothetical protein
LNNSKVIEPKTSEIKEHKKRHEFDDNNGSNHFDEMNCKNNSHNLFKTAFSKIVNHEEITHTKNISSKEKFYRMKLKKWRKAVTTKNRRFLNVIRAVCFLFMVLMLAAIAIVSYVYYYEFVRHN